MAFEATTPFALACLGDSVKSCESLRLLGQEKPASEREQDLLALATSWDVTMTEREACEVVSEYDLVTSAQPAARHNLSAASASASASAS